MKTCVLSDEQFDVQGGQVTVEGITRKGHVGGECEDLLAVTVPGF